MNRRLPLCYFTLIGAISDMYLNLTYYKPNKFTMCVLVLQINTHTHDGNECLKNLRNKPDIIFASSLI